MICGQCVTDGKLVCTFIAETDLCGVLDADLLRVEYFSVCNVVSSKKEESNFGILVYM